ncbi:thiol-disulfide oxidoreductase DCC family protein [Psychroflexus halocasei]|uniref:Predicted thiol-disulfide oxidoreductase YuxK, DCC family n=1 Tax=Psychroflexus halocasei TaxID=908615 RepID=A0A1H3WTJ4_9FLAO|nr:DCC1-like thiol-disulfide oxidoreductase family protein [Psychroflexus halocasei]SDZ90487.1 Predicted thiol-disulfide oxidoreductase YuxK, DCC family [Psychroflexus halocasei]
MEIPKNKQIVLFDGVCNLCHNAVQFIIKRDPKNKFVFASLDSEIGEKLLSERHIDRSKIDSIVLIIPDDAYFIKSDAALEISKSLSSIYPIFSYFSILPQAFRDFVYDLIAKNRYRIFGKKEECPLPSPAQREKFLS